MEKSHVGIHGITTRWYSLGACPAALLYDYRFWPGHADHNEEAVSAMAVNRLRNVTNGHLRAPLD